MIISIPAYGMDGLYAGCHIKAPIDMTPATPISVHSPGFARTLTPYFVWEKVKIHVRRQSAHDLKVPLSETYHLKAPEKDSKNCG